MLYLKLRRGISFALLLTVCGGCQSQPSDLPDLGTVQGTITLNGQPLPEATVIFQPEDGRPSSGKTDASGKFELSYTEAASGAKIGQHAVQITTVPPDDIANERVPAKYNVESTLTADVKSGKNEFQFDLESKE